MSEVGASVDAAYPQDVYHVIPRMVARDVDFLSGAARHIRAIRDGRQATAIPDIGDLLHMWSGVSVYGLEARARAVASYRQWAWAVAVARMRLGDPLIADGTIRIEKTGADPHHYTLWGDPETLRACIESSIAI